MPPKRFERVVATRGGSASLPRANVLQLIPHSTIAVFPYSFLSTRRSLAPCLNILSLLTLTLRRQHGGLETAMEVGISSMNWTNIDLTINRTTSNNNILFRVSRQFNLHKLFQKETASGQKSAHTQVSTCFTRIEVAPQTSGFDLGPVSITTPSTCHRSQRTGSPSSTFAFSADTTGRR